MQLRTRSCSTSARRSTAACCSPRTTTRCAPSLAPRPAWRWATWRRWCGRPLSTLRQLAAAAATTSSPSCTSCKKGPARAATACRCASASAPDPPRLTVGMCTPASTFIAMHHLSHYGMPSWQWKCPCVHFFFLQVARLAGIPVPVVAAAEKAGARVEHRLQVGPAVHVVNQFLLKLCL